MICVVRRKDSEADFSLRCEFPNGLVHEELWDWTTVGNGHFVVELVDGWPGLWSVVVADRVPGCEESEFQQVVRGVGVDFGVDLLPEKATSVGF